MSLTRFLSSGELAGKPASTYLAQLSQPWCWPVNDELARSAGSLGVAAPIPPPAGETLVLGVGDEAVFRLHSGATPPTNRLDLRGRATASARLARRIVARDLPILPGTEALSRRQVWFASPIAIATGRRPTVLDGDSYGLALGLATASLVLNESLPVDLAASAALCADGSVGDVGSLTPKIQMIVEDAPGIRRFLVPVSQRSEAERACEETFRTLGLKPWLEIVPVSRFADALHLAFGELAARVAAKWTPEDIEPMVDALYRVTLFGDPIVLGWRGIVACAEALERRPELGAEARERVRVAIAIAARHDSRGKELSWPADEVLQSMPRPRRLRFIAHVVQSVTDASSPSPELLERAGRYVNARLERSSEDCVLLGALGRAFAAAGNDALAKKHLQEAIEGWHEVAEPNQASFALCELVRILGIAANDGDHSAKTELVEVIETAVEDFEQLPNASTTSIGFVRLAAGRALTQANSPQRALDYLEDDEDWLPHAPHVEAARLRWLARALDAVGRAPDAERRRLDLHQMAFDRNAGNAPRLKGQYDLARLDVAIRTGAPTNEILQNLDDDTRRLLAHCPSGSDPARFVAERYRY